VVAVSGSVALLGDTLHNATDALTAVPLGIAFVVGRRPPTRRYTYGYGRAEDLAGVVIVVVIAASSALAAYEAITRLAHPRPVIVDAAASAVQAHQVAVSAEHNLLHALPRLAAALVHADPQAPEGTDHHAALASHR
jgi:cation diffusion facilitator family transporter